MGNWAAFGYLERKSMQKDSLSGRYEMSLAICLPDFGGPNKGSGNSRSRM